MESPHQNRLNAVGVSLALIPLSILTTSVTAGSVLIQEVFVDKPASGQMEIVGQGFGGSPKVTLGTFGMLSLDFVSDTHIVANLPGGFRMGNIC